MVNLTLQEEIDNYLFREHIRMVGYHQSCMGILLYLKLLSIECSALLDIHATQFRGMYKTNKSRTSQSAIHRLISKVCFMFFKNL